MGLSNIKDSYVRRKEIPFSSEQKWMAVKCSPKSEVRVLLCPFPRLLPTESKMQAQLSV